MSVAENLQRVREQIETAALQAGRKSGEIMLVAVSKTMPADSVLEAVKAGVTDLGENRVEEAADKIPVVAQTAITRNIRWHLIGHLQRRKTRDAVALFDMIQSVDTLRLAETIHRHAGELDKRVPVLLQVNIGNDPNKSGFSLERRDDFYRDVDKTIALANIQVQGLMTIGPWVATPEEARPFFRELRILREDLMQRFPQTNWQELSMGMTDDYTVAIQEGATIVRIGRAIFGSRETNK